MFQSLDLDSWLEIKSDNKELYYLDWLLCAEVRLSFFFSNDRFSESKCTSCALSFFDYFNIYLFTYA